MDAGVPQLCTGGHTQTHTGPYFLFLVPLFCVIGRLEMPGFRGQLAVWHPASGNDIWE